MTTHRHQGATHEIFVHADRFEWQMFPQTIADLAFDSESWIVTVDGVACGQLELKGSQATDDEIVAELYTSPLVYQARIIR